MPFLTGAKARSFAETRWGRGGTHAYKTNRRGVFYYSCSGHGGYVLDGNALTEGERKEIDKYVSPEKCLLVYNRTTHRVIFLSNPFTVRTQRYRYNPETQDLIAEYPIYFFEEDCDWAVLEKFTDIRAKHNVTEERRQEIIDQTFNRWHANKAA